MIKITSNAKVWALIGAMLLCGQATAGGILPIAEIQRAVEYVLGPRCEVSRKPSMRGSEGVEVHVVKTPDGKNYVAIAREGYEASKAANQRQELKDKYKARCPGAPIPNVSFPIACLEYRIAEDGTVIPVLTNDEEESDEYEQPGAETVRHVTLEFQERAPGKDLRRTLSDLLAGKISERRLIQIAREMGRAVASLHNLGRNGEDETTETLHGDLHGGNIIIKSGVAGTSLPSITFIDTAPCEQQSVELDLRNLINNLAGAIADAEQEYKVRVTAALHVAIFEFMRTYNEEWEGSPIKTMVTEEVFRRIPLHSTSQIMIQGVMFTIDQDHNKTKPYTRAEAYNKYGTDIVYMGNKRYPILDLMYPFCSLREFGEIYGGDEAVGHTVAVSVMGEVLRKWLMSRESSPSRATWMRIIDTIEEAVTTVGEVVGEYQGQDCRPAIDRFVGRLNEIGGGAQPVDLTP
ncbi:MAG: hypothetical protein LBR78_00760 [Holosporales bacterium]|jgi:tRNA A-37 threonylcarbamoyl transferase component Bud32|nr:hypothetical protein [Holosporales bacterium]